MVSIGRADRALLPEAARSRALSDWNRAYGANLFLQHWYGLSDPAMEEALYDMEVMRKFISIDLGRERVVDETTICKFRHLLESEALAA